MSLAFCLLSQGVAGCTYPHLAHTVVRYLLTEGRTSEKERNRQILMNKQRLREEEDRRIMEEIKIKALLTPTQIFLRLLGLT